MKNNPCLNLTQSVETLLSLSQIWMQGFTSMIGKNTEFIKKQLSRANECATASDKNHTCSTHALGSWQDSSDVIIENATTTMDTMIKCQKEMAEALKANMNSDTCEKANKPTK